MSVFNERGDRDAVPQLIIFTTHHTKMSLYTIAKSTQGLRTTAETTAERPLNY